MVRITEDLIRKRAEHNELMVRISLIPSRSVRPDLPEENSDLSKNQIFRNHAILKLN